MIKLILALALLTSSAFAAKTVKLTWNHPTKREDGTTLVVSEIKGYQIEVNVQGSAPYLVIDVPPEEMAGPFSLVGNDAIIIGDEVNCFKIRATDSTDQVSEWSDSVCVEIPFDVLDIIIDVRVKDI